MSFFKKIAKENLKNRKNGELKSFSIQNQNIIRTGFSLDDINNFQNTFFDVHEFAINRYKITKSEDDAMIAIDAILAIQDLKKGF